MNRLLLIALGGLGVVGMLEVAGCGGGGDPSGETTTSGVASQTTPAVTTDDSTTTTTTSTSSSSGSTTDVAPTSSSSGDPTTGGSSTGPGPLCGDGNVDEGEECDVGADNSDFSACTESCKNSVCGDGLVKAGAEACDDGNQVDDDTCTNDCALASCGDGTVQLGEECDDGNEDFTDECLSNCLNASCGDGAIHKGIEDCDDGNFDDTDNCLATCVPAKCGDSVVHAGVEDCDDGNADDTDACLGTCKAATCGDKLVQVGVEDCDDGNADDTDSCLGSCKAAKCGDGVVQVGVEQCDDKNLDEADGCTSACTIPKTCKDVIDAVPLAKDGLYYIDPDGPMMGGLPPFQVQCDMTTAGGGWTLIEKSPYGGLTIGKALYQDLPINPDDPTAPRHRLSKATMTILRDLSTDLRIDCRGGDYLLAAATNLFNGQGGPNNCNNWSKVTYKEAQLKGNKLLNKVICTWNPGTSEGCAGAWHIDESAQAAYCGNGFPNNMWKGVAVTSPSADTFATDPVTLDGVNPVHDCHKNSAVRWFMLR